MSGLILGFPCEKVTPHRSWLDQEFCLAKDQLETARRYDLHDKHTIELYLAARERLAVCKRIEEIAARCGTLS